MTTPIEILESKLTKSDESFTINIYDNGYMIEVGGRNEEDDWSSAKILCSNIQEIYDVIEFIIHKLPRT
jgi:hypothetical protein